MLCNACGGYVCNRRNLTFLRVKFSFTFYSINFLQSRPHTNSTVAITHRHHRNVYVNIIRFIFYKWQHGICARSSNINIKLELGQRVTQWFAWNEPNKLAARKCINYMWHAKQPTWINAIFGKRIRIKNFLYFFGDLFVGFCRFRSIVAMNTT